MWLEIFFSHKSNSKITNVHLFICLYVCPSVHLSVRLSVCPSVYLSVRLYLRHCRLIIMSFKYYYAIFWGTYPLTYICIFSSSFMFVELLKYPYLSTGGRGVSKRYFMDITVGMGSKTCQNMISILKNSLILNFKQTFGMDFWKCRSDLGCRM